MLRSDPSPIPNSDCPRAESGGCEMRSFLPWTSDKRVHLTCSGLCCKRILQEKTAAQWANGLAYRLSMTWTGLQTKKRIPRVAEVPLSVRLKLHDVPAPSSTMSLSVGWPGWTCCSSQHQNQSRRQRGQVMVMNGSDKQLFD